MTTTASQTNSQSHRSDRRPLRSSARIALTLVEIMIAMVMTLIVLYAMMEAFRYASGEIKRGRAVIEMSNQLRAAQELFRSDLESMTLDPRPWTQTATPRGYFEYLESVGRDASNAANANNYLGDVDDVVAFTASRPDRPFRGRYVDPLTGTLQIVESTLAEIIWWTDWDDRDADGAVDYDESVTLYRRVLLIRPDLSFAGVVPNATFFSENDISTRVVGGNVVANRLEDLGYRSARFCHAGPFPHPIDRTLLRQYRMAVGGTLTGDDVVLSDVASFDIRVYSPNSTSIEALGGSVLVDPGDVGFGAIPPTTNGAFVDLNHGAGGWFSGLPHLKSGLATPIDVAYDTWTPLYESDGLIQNGQTDLATNGIDDDGVNGVDDTGERDTMPPYPHPIRGLQATFRMVEKSTHQVRQVSVIHSFVPE